MFDCLYIPERIVTKGLFGRIRDWERQFYTSTPIDVVRFVKREGCPKFDELQNGPEDSDWDRRVTGKRGVTTSPIYHHDNVSFINYFKKKAYYSKSMQRFIERNPKDKVLDFKWRCFGVFIEKGKWKRFISNPILALCVLFTIFLRGIVYKINK